MAVMTVACVLLPALMAGTTQGHAAIRLCRPAVTGEPQEAASEPEARRLALASWVAMAERSYGDHYTAWRLAYRKSLDCAAISEGRIRCTATGHPCTISQITPPDWRSNPDLVPVPAPRMR